MDDPISPARRTLLKAGAATLATPVAAAIRSVMANDNSWLLIGKLKRLAA